jgi:hypothetical protein
MNKYKFDKSGGWEIVFAVGLIVGVMAIIEGVFGVCLR